MATNVKYKQRVGEDLFLELTLKWSGEAADLTNAVNTKLLIEQIGCPWNKYHGFTITGNVVSMQLTAEENTHCGIFNATFSADIPNANSSTGYVTRKWDFRYLYMIVATSDEEALSDTVESTGEIAKYGSDGLSAYEVAVKNGYVGTITEWLAYLRKPAVDAAASLSVLESSVSSNETTRNSNETIRIDNENERIEGENTRSSNENNRAISEAARNENETLRVASEKSRVTSETSRVNAENVRVESENKRTSSETERANEESKRVTAENSRNAAESNRATAESNRVTAESSRATAENARKDAETNRVTAESARTTNENERVAAENARVAAETARESNSATAVTNANNAASNANTAASNFVNAVVQEEGTNTDKVISQKVVTDELANKVDKIAGMGLSTNDYTNTDKSQVAANKETNSVQDTVVAEALAKLNQEFEAFKKMLQSGNIGDIHVTSVNTDSVPMYCGQQMILNGSGSPITNAVLPDFVGQIYIDTTNRNAYMCCDSSSASYWKLIN